MTSYKRVSTDATYTADRALETIGMGRFQFLIILVTGLSYTAESMEMLLLSFIKLPLQCTWGISDAQASLITTAVGVGMLTGSTVFGLLADAFGRRIVFIVSTFITFALGLASALSVNYWMLLITRGGVGFGIGGIPVSYTLLTEFLPSSARGKWGTGISFFWSFGAIFESLVALAVLPALGWRWLIGISTAPLLFVLLLTFFVQESPRWLVSRGRINEAEAVIQSVAESNGAPLPEGSLVTTEDVKGGFRELFKRGARGLALKVFIMWFACAFLYYGLVMLQPELIAQESAGRRCPQYGRLECAGLNQGKCTDDALCKWDGKQCSAAAGRSFLLRAEREDATGDAATTDSGGDDTGKDPKSDSAATEDTKPPRPTSGAGQNTRSTPEEIKREACATQLTRGDFVATLLSSAGELPGTVVSLWLIDVLGRRPLLGYDFGVTGVLIVILLACIGRTWETIIFFLVRGSATGAFQVIYLYTNEIYPARIRAMAMGISSSIARIGLILTPLVAQTLTNINLPSALWTYFGISFLAVLAVLLTPIETTRRPLLDTMDELVDILKGNNVDTAGSFAKDPGANWLVRFLRWNARVDGGATAALPG